MNARLAMLSAIWFDADATDPAVRQHRRRGEHAHLERDL